MTPVSKSRKKKTSARTKNPIGTAPRGPALWREGADGDIETVRDAEHWQRSGDQVACSLCYRNCELADGEDGTCGFRGNRNGKMQLLSHGIITSVVRQIHGYSVDPFLTYKPGQTSVFFGGQQCTSACTFCMSTDLVLAPERVPWALPPSRLAPDDSTWYAQKALMHPVDAIGCVGHHRASSATFGINEPTLSIEWTTDVAKLAKHRGLDVLVESNGFTGTDAIRQLAKYVDAVDIGVKGSADPEFYERRMRSPGAVPAVLESLKTWREAGVHVIVGDLLSPPHWQDDAAFDDAAKRFYDYIAETLGPLTAVLITQILPPGPTGKATSPYRTLVRSATEEAQYDDRINRALALARAAGLPYAHPKSPDWTITCHECGGSLLKFADSCTANWPASGLPDSVECVMPQRYCPWWRHEQHVTNSRCDHCGTQVPIVTVKTDHLGREQTKVIRAWEPYGGVPYVTGDVD